jgi:choline monooxygenase
MTGNDLLASGAYEDVRKPVTEAATLPPHCYTAQDWYDAEVEQMWRHSWLLLGRVEEVPKPGDYHCLDLLGEPLIMVRAEDGTVRVFSAVCRHRGCIVRTGDGNDRYLACPYHGWTYGLTGELVSVPGMREARNFRKEDYSLAQIRSEIWGGFVFITFDRDCPPLLSGFGELAERLSPYRFEDMVVTKKFVTPIEANWKLWLENSREGYHAPVVHAKSYQRFYQKGGSQEWRYSGRSGVWEMMSGPNNDGLYLPLKPTLPMIEGLSAEDLETTHFAIYYPHVLFNVPPSHLAFHQLFPHGPGATTVVTWFCFPKSTASLPEFDHEVAAYYEMVEAFVPEDKRICGLTQRGLSSRFARAGRFSIHEQPCHSFSNWLLDHVLPSESARP